jgi:sugar phosphate isomerase/epimerase
MQLGIFARTFARQTVEEVFDAVAGHGLACVQFNFACAGLPSLPERIAPELLGRISRASCERGITIAAVSGTFNMIHPDPEQRREGLRKLDVVAAASARLGSGLVTLCTGTRDPQNMWRRHPDNDLDEAWRDLVATLTGALTIADRHDVALGLEPETGNVIASARQARRLLDELRSPRLKIIMDPANLLRPDDLPRMNAMLEEAFELLGADIVLAHAKELDATGHAGGLPLGSGVIDWEQYLAGLRQANFAGPIVLHGFEEAGVEASVAFIRRKLRS